MLTTSAGYDKLSGRCSGLTLNPEFAADDTILLFEGQACALTGKVWHTTPRLIDWAAPLLLTKVPDKACWPH